MKPRWSSSLASRWPYSKAMSAPSKSRLRSISRWPAACSVDVAVDQMVLDGPGGHLCARAQAQTVQYVLDVVLSGALAHDQPLGDVAVRQPLSDQRRDFAFARAQLRHRVTLPTGVRPRGIELHSEGDHLVQVEDSPGL